MYGLTLIVLYTAAILAPLVIILLFGYEGEHGVLFETGRTFALSAFVILALQAFLTARFKWIEKSFSHGSLIRFHRAMGSFGLALLILHPVFLAFGGDGILLLTSIDLPWYVLLGKLALVLLAVQVGLAYLWKNIGFGYIPWKRSHYIISVSIILLAFIHSLFTGDDLERMELRLFWILVLIAAIYAHVGPRLNKRA